MECWQSGNAPDSKSGEPSIPWRAGSNPVHSLIFDKKTKSLYAEPVQIRYIDFVDVVSCHY